MTRSRNPVTSRGMALLIVLAALVLIVTGCVSLLRVAMTARTQHMFDVRAMNADDFLRAAQAPILKWLVTKSSTVVLPPEADFPRVEICHDRINTASDSITLQICAFDQCGMAPLHTIRTGLPIRLALPAEVVRAADDLIIDDDAKTGLDLFSIELDAHLQAEVVRVFPVCVDSTPTMLGKRFTIEDRAPGENLPDNAREIWIGAFVATHTGSDEVGRSGVMNVNTAPLELIAAVMRHTGVGGMEQISASRLRGEMAEAPAKVGADQSDRIRLVSMSSVWSFRIDIQVGTLKRSWWAVYSKRDNPIRPWECVQRLAINE